MLLTLAVVLPTPHDYSGTFQGGYSARFTASRRSCNGSRFCALPKQLTEVTKHTTLVRDLRTYVHAYACT